MAIKAILPDEILDNIADQIGDLLPALLRQESLQPRSVELRESFPVWTLDLSAPERPASSGTRLPVQDALYWYHQILFDGEPKAYAESELAESQPARVCMVSVSPLPELVDKAISWVEGNVKEPVLVRLLAIPSLLVYTLWLVDIRQIYVIDALPAFANLEPGRLLKEEEFLSAIYSALQLF